MNKVTIRAAHNSDSEAISNFLAIYFPEPSSFFLNMLRNPLMAEGPDLGLVIDCDSRIMGYIGVIYSERFFPEGYRRVHNFTCWRVHPDFKRYSLELFKRIVTDKNTVFTGLSAAAPVHQVLNFFKFDTLDEGKLIFNRPAYWWRLFVGDRPELALDTDTMYQFVSKSERSLLESHIAGGCGAALLHHQDKYCLIIMVGRVYHKRQFADILYSSSWSLLQEWLPWAARAASHTVGSGRLGIDKRRICIHSPFTTKYIKKTFYKSTGVAKEHIDSLYSEFAAQYGRPD
jgi:hypothetical protein